MPWTETMKIASNRSVKWRQEYPPGVLIQCTEVVPASWELGVTQEIKGEAREGISGIDQCHPSCIYHTVTPIYGVSLTIVAPSL